MPHQDSQSKLTDDPFKSAYQALRGADFGVVNTDKKNSDNFRQRLQAISDQEKAGLTWHVIADNLSAPEAAGLIQTELSRSLHALLGLSPGQRFLIPQAFLAEGRLPNPAAYRHSLFSVTVNQRLALQEVVRSLAAAGYVRHRTSLEPGGFRVKGEVVEIHHPALPGTVALTFYGSSLETITVAEGRRAKSETRITLPPVQFPGETVALARFLKERRSLTLNLPPFLVPAAPSPASTSPVSRERALELISVLEPGTFAVHTDHGIGLYEGLKIKAVAGADHEYLVLQYAQADVLYVPVEFAHKVSAYVGAAAPAVHRLGGTVWAKTKRRAQAEAAEFAKELLAIAGKRSASQRPAHFLSPDLEEALEKSFPYTLTADQSRTWQEVKRDMRREEPLDRLIVGDVGFGKTEIAIRAAAHLARSGYQVAVVAPTTLLVQQHSDTFQARLASLPVSSLGFAPQIATLSRFSPAGQTRQAKAALASGAARIAIGTQALLNPRLAWKNLGLVIIDEEQKFGVRQKEHFKKLRATTDILSLSATPIPRTLAMSLSGLRDLSLIQTPPAERLSVITHVGARHDAVLAEALTQEVTRGGQVYLVASKIKHLPSIREHVAALMEKHLPKSRPARLAVAHGRLPAAELARIMHAFDQGEIDILMSSNIVENGLDLPNANTMIVWNATDFGLADLYQLRGRVGRRARQGYAYFFYNQHELTSVQRQRLTALVEASRLGEGWSIARRDLEIRGAGNLLGAEQSGVANEVGVQLYLDLINQASQNLATETVELPETQVALPLPAIIPATYISSTSERARTYQRLARASLAELSARVTELEQTFGPLPEPTQNLILLLKLQRVAAQAKLTKIDSKIITPPGETPFYRITLHGKTVTTLETPAVTADFVQKLTATLSQTSPKTNP